MTEVIDHQNESSDFDPAIWQFVDTSMTHPVRMTSIDASEPSVAGVHFTICS